MSEWISVDDRLPENHKNVLAFNRHTYVASIEESGKWYESVAFESLHNVTHWQPLPAPPTI